MGGPIVEVREISKRFFGFAFAALVLILRDANTLVDVSNDAAIMLAGGQFPVQALPWFVLPISLALPLTHGFDAVRGLLLNTTTLLPVADEVAILLAFMVLMAPSGYAIFRLVERRCKELGTLGMHEVRNGQPRCAATGPGGAGRRAAVAAGGLPEIYHDGLPGRTEWASEPPCVGRVSGRPLLAFLVAAGEAAVRGSPPPSLLPAPQGG